MGPLRLLFVSGVSLGGARASTLDLARRLGERGHEVTVLVGRPGVEDGYVDFWTRAWVKCKRLGPLAWLVRQPVRFVGQKIRPAATSAPPAFECRQAAAAARRLLRKSDFDVVIANSIARAPMQWLVEDCHRVETPVVLYMRETHSVSHLDLSGLPFDGVVANARALSVGAREAGYDVEYFPSTLDLVAIETTRAVVLFINPVEANRPELFFTVADHLPDHEFVMQESWPLDPRTKASLLKRIEGRPNVVFRGRTDDVRELYGDARVLWAPYPSGRPRVVLEAQFNGIPVIGLGQAALSEAIGPGGIVVDAQAEHDQWVAALCQLDDPVVFEHFSKEAAAHARRAEVDPEQIADGFEDYLHNLVTRR